MTNSSQDAEGLSKQVADARGSEANADEHILYVDDDTSLVFLVTCILERLKYRVTGCTDPSTALDMFRADPTGFRAVVSDLSMPGMSGIEFAQEVLKIRADIPILMTSGDIRPQDAAAVRSLNLPDLVLKPCTVEVLGKLLDNLLKRPPANRTDPPRC